LGNLHNEELNDMHASPNICQVIKSRRIRLVGNVARMGKGEAYTRCWWRHIRERDHLGELRL